jgi:glycosyltransferase involved in cell wall biosynthesis
MPVNVVLTAYVANPSFKGGGPVWTALQLLKTAATESDVQYRFTAVFIDKVLRSIDDADPASDTKAPPKFAGLPLKSYLLPTARYLLRLRRTTRSLRPSETVILHAHDPISAYLARHVFLPYPQILTIHSVGSWVTAGFLQLRPHIRGSLAERFFRHMERDAIRHARIVVFPSKQAVQLFEADYPDSLSSKDVRIVNTGIDSGEIAAACADPMLLCEYGIQGKRLLLCAAPHSRQKGLHILIEAITALPPSLKETLVLLLIGRGPLTSELAALVQERALESTVKFVERVPELIPFMKMADAFVLTPTETVFDLVFLEAMAAKLPVITTALPGNRQMFGSDAALLVPPEDPAAVRDAIVRLLDDEALRQSLVEKAYRRVTEKFTPSRMLEQYLDLYESLRPLKESRSQPEGETP